MKKQNIEPNPNLDAYTPEQLIELLKYQTPTELLSNQKKILMAKQIKKESKDPRHGPVIIKKLPVQPPPKLILPK